MPVTVKRPSTRFTVLQVCNRFMGKVAAVFAFIDQATFVLAGGSTVGANTTVEFTVPIKNCALGDVFRVQPSSNLPTGLMVSYAYVSLASVGSTSPQTTETSGAIKVRIGNLTAGALDAAATYTYFQTSTSAGAV